MIKTKKKYILTKQKKGKTNYYNSLLFTNVVLKENTMGWNTLNNNNKKTNMKYSEKLQTENILYVYKSKEITKINY